MNNLEWTGLIVYKNDEDKIVVQHPDGELRTLNICWHQIKLLKVGDTVKGTGARMTHCTRILYPAKRGWIW